MAYMENAVEPREDLLGHLRHCVACWQYGRSQHRGQNGVNSRQGPDVNDCLQYYLIDLNQVPADQTRAQRQRW